MDTHLDRLLLAAGVLAFTACGDANGPTGPSTQGAVRVTATTTGVDLPAAGYTVSVDSGAGQAIPLNGGVTLSGLRPGSHSVTLYGAPPNCALAGANTRAVDVIAGDTVVVAFNVGCSATSGAVRVTAATTGVDLPSAGYTVSVDSGAGQAVPVNGGVTLSGLRPGSHSVTLYGAPPNCALAGANTRAVDVIAADTVLVAFKVGCLPTSGSGASVIAYTDDSYSSVIAVMLADGGGKVMLTQGPSDYEPAWSPDRGPRLHSRSTTVETPSVPRCGS